MSQKTGSELATAYSRMMSGSEDAQDILWEIIEDIQSSYHLALQDVLPRYTLKDIENTVSSYLSNTYGD